MLKVGYIFALLFGTLGGFISSVDGAEFGYAGLDGTLAGLDGTLAGLDGTLDELEHVDVILRQAARTRREAIDGRPSCKDGSNTAEDSSQKLGSLRMAMYNVEGSLNGQQALFNLSAYFLPMDDAHQSEYVADADKRIKYISGFSGSAGNVVVGLSAAALWTDGRYFLQGEQQLDCNWHLMKAGEAGVPSTEEWIQQQVPQGGFVGADPTQMSHDRWASLKTILDMSSIGLVEVTNLVDIVWDASGERPTQPAHPLEVLAIEYTGESWQDKVARVREEMKGKASVAVFTALDENAWLFNLRGGDIKFTPVFFSYSIVEEHRVTLYVRTPDVLITDEVRTHLNRPEGGQPCGTDCVHVLEYGAFFTDLENKANSSAGAVWYSPMSSYATYSRLQPSKVFKVPSCIRDMKGRKNPTEIAGLKKCHIRDSAALIEWVASLEKEIQSGKVWDEISASDELENVRKQQDKNRGLSFATISGSGPNGAIIHYKATNATKRKLTTTEVYLVDSGGQYLDGTTDVTRTFHFGNPRDFEKEAYTRVLMGAINLATAVWPQGLYGHQIDTYARRPLWEAGLDYKHGTGHGIGAYLGVHEGPGRINMGYRPSAYESILYPDMFFSDEPGYYEDGQFGIRLETIVRVKIVDTPHTFNAEQYLGFEEFTLVPFEPNLIKYELLSPQMRKWMNVYNKRIRSDVGPLLKANGKTLAYDWMMERTEHIPDEPNYNSATVTSYHHVVLFTILFTSFSL